MTNRSLAEIKASIHGLDESRINPDPFAQFATWFDEAHEADLPLPMSMSLATVSKDGQPSIRTLFLKSFDANGFVFYTNYGSRKASELEVNPQCALLFHWTELERQVRIEGSVTRVSREESDTYFHTRPRESQIGAWASRQSEELDSRETLMARVADYTSNFEGGEVPLPDWWGGYRLEPRLIEFWQGIEFRLHDRLVFTRDGSGWELQRLNP